MKDFQIVIPSRGRPDNMKRMMSLLPSAVVYVDEREEKAYSRVVPKEKLFLHEPTETHVQMRTALGRDKRFPHTLVGVDDDLVAINFHPGRRSRRTQDGEVIEAVIRSTAQVARDLDIKLFGWARFAHPGLFQMHNPITFSGLVAGAWGVNGDRVLVDSRLINKHDIDASLQCLLDHRILLTDNRFYFDFGNVGTGKGGCQSALSADTVSSDEEFLRRKWGEYCHMGDRKKMNRKSMGGKTMSIRVPRKAALVDLK